VTPDIDEPIALRLGTAWAVAVVTLALAGLAVLAPIGVLAAGVIKPDTACADEATYKSLKGDDKAELTVINNSDETVKVWWLNYDGKRVFYRDLAKHTSYVQATWLTHPWVVSSTAGDCYRFLVMTSLKQSVTVAPETPDPAATVVPESSTAASAPGGSPAAVVPEASPAATSPSNRPTTGATSPDYTWLLIMGVLASVVAVLIAIAAGTGRLPGFPRGGRGGQP
jgi:hypothetical protein